MIMKKSLAIPSLALAAALLSPLAWSAEKTVATVNGTAITQSMVDDYKRQSPTGQKAPMSDERAVDELVGRELVYQDALARKLDKDPEVKKQMEFLRKQVLLNAALEKAVGEREVTDEMLKKEYDTQVSNFNIQEYKARHILVKTEAEAKAIIGELDKGGDFAKLAEKHSTDPGSKKNGGDLGWFGPGQMVPQFTTATQALSKGSYTKTPVETQFGWHIIKLEDTRKAQPPAFEQVKEQLRSHIQQRFVSDYLQSLKSKAKISKP
ncbi:MAG TPA: peptidylprolyl isomerase [Gammaproteobacteria bacterium]